MDSCIRAAARLSACAVAFALLVIGAPALAQTSGLDSITGAQCNVGVTPTCQVPVSGTFLASISSFQPSPSGARMTPLSVLVTDSSGNLPTGAQNLVFNTDTTNPIYCNENGVAATVGDAKIPANSWLEFTPATGVTALHCIATGGTVQANGLGGSGLATGAGGGGGGSGGGAVTLASGAVAAGAYSAGAFVSGSILSGALADGSIVTIGTKADAATCATTNTLLACSRQTDTDLKALGTGLLFTDAHGTTLTTDIINLGTTNLATDAHFTTINGTANTQAHTCAITAYTVPSCLGQIDDDVKGNIAGPLGRAADAASLSVALSTEDVAIFNGATPAGNNIIGRVGVDQTTPGTTNGVQTLSGSVESPAAAATGGATPASVLSANSTNATNVKNAAGTLYHISLQNNSTSALAYAIFFNTASTPTCTATPYYGPILLPFVGSTGNNGSGVIEDIAVGMNFPTGISYCLTTAPAGTGSVAANQVSGGLGYK